MEQYLGEAVNFISQNPGFCLAAVAHLGVVINRSIVAPRINNESYYRRSIVAEHFVSRSTLPLFYDGGFKLLGSSASEQSNNLPVLLTIAHSLIWETLGTIEAKRIRWRHLLSDFAGIGFYKALSMFVKIT